MYFDRDFDSMEALRQYFRKLCLELHPDKHQGEEKVFEQYFKAMMNEYDEFLKSFIPGENRKRKKENQVNFDAESELGKVIASLIRLSGLTIEICGSWLWIGGNTFQYREVLKTKGCKWQPKKKLWYFAGYEFIPKRTKIQDMNTIRVKYGSIMMESEEMAGLPA